MAGSGLAVIVGATGPTGIHLAGELIARGMRVRVVARRREALERAFAGVDAERLAADALDRDALCRAVAGADLVFDCIGLPAAQMRQHPMAAKAITEAASGAGARCVQVSSYWSYLPISHLPLGESHPRAGGNAHIRARREAEDVMLAAGAAVAQLPDFFGPHVHASTLQRPLEEAAAGSAMSFVGAADSEREYAFVPDAMAMVAELALRDEAFGCAWLVPGSGPLSAARVAAIAGRHLGREVKVRTAPVWLLRLLALSSAELRQISPMLPHYARPLRFDSSRLRALLGDLPVTPYEEAIPTTLDWMARR